MGVSDVCLTACYTKFYRQCIIVGTTLNFINKINNNKIEFDFKNSKQFLIK